MERSIITIRDCGALFSQPFVFELKDEEAAWYDLDGCESKNKDGSMKINADREVYAVLTLADGEKRYGTIGDSEDKTLADNFPLQDGEEYLFYEDPRTETQYV